MNCDRIANWYRWLEYASFGSALHARRVEYIGDLLQARRVLILGDGDGRFTAEFLKQNREALVDSVDLSARMLDLARRRISPRDRGRICFHHTDALRFAVSHPYDLIVTHFVLDCLSSEAVCLLAARITQSASQNALWLISEFRMPRGFVPRAFAAILIRTLYFAFQLFTGLDVTRLPDYAGALDQCGFRRKCHKIAAGGLLISELWERVVPANV
jgi:SAM-dependent methyltransferase